MLFDVFFFKQKTAYEMRISDWSSDVCSSDLPFMRRHIEIVRPKVLVLLGGTAAKTVLERSEGILKLRGKWYEFTSPGLDGPIPALATLHPAYLLRSPLQKREAWRDMLSLKLKLRERA